MPASGQYDPEWSLGWWLEAQIANRGIQDLRQLAELRLPTEEVKNLLMPLLESRPPTIRLASGHEAEVLWKGSRGYVWGSEESEVDPDDPVIKKIKEAGHLLFARWQSERYVYGDRHNDGETVRHTHTRQIL